jgi:hypothetical protein
MLMDGCADEHTRIKALVWANCLHDCQLVHLHGAGSRSPTHFGGGARATCHDRRTSRSRGELVRGGDLSCKAETCRVRRRFVGGYPPCGELVGDDAH